MSDLISRQEAITAIESHIRTAEEPYQLTEEDRVMNYAFDVSVSCLMNLPQVEQKTDKWIPCSERLPKEFYVLCCDNHGEMLIANTFECGDSDTGFSAESEDCYMYNCVAWMPLPEPWEGEK